MSEAKHTPGPWSVDFDPDRSPNIWINAPTNAGVAKIEVCDYGDGKGHRLTDEDHANAHLITAAPDLLFLAKWMVDNPGECLGDHGSIERQGREIVAKAEGRS